MGRIVRHRPEPQSARASAPCPAGEPPVGSARPLKSRTRSDRGRFRAWGLRARHQNAALPSVAGASRGPERRCAPPRLGQISAGDWVRFGRRATISPAGRHRSGGAAASLGVDRRVSYPWITALALGTVDEPLADPRLFPVTPPKFAPPLPAGRLTPTELQWPLRRVPAPAPTDGPL
jgi:hypothetical protein